MKCNHNCFECPYQDCIDDSITYAEIKAIKAEDQQQLRERELEKPNIDYRRRWELKNLERAKANKKRHYQRNKEKYREHNRKYYAEHKAEILEQHKSYYADNRESIAVRSREHYLALKGET